jgi:hypothetical protein
MTGAIGSASRRRLLMNDGEHTLLVLRDNTGRFYLLSPQLPAAARVSDEEQTRLEALFADQAVTGYGGVYGGAGSLSGLSVTDVTTLTLLSLATGAQADL